MNATTDSGMSKEVKVMFRRTRGVGLTLLALCLLIGAAAPSAVVAQDSQNNHNAAFLRSGVDARYFGMGGTGVAIADDAAAAYWNPAGLVNFTGLFATGMYTGGMNFDRRNNYVSVAYGFENWAIAGSWINAGTDDLIASGTPNGTGTFNFNENALALSAALKAGPLNLGASGKMVTQDLGITPTGSGEDNVTGFGLDLGAQIAVTHMVSLGMSIQDLFTRVGDQDAGEVDEVPLNLRFGAVVVPIEGLTVAADMEKATDDAKWRLHFGAEYWRHINETFAAGVRLGNDNGDFAAGVGVGVGPVVFNYAYVNEPEQFLGENHRFSVNLEFGEKRGMYRMSGTSDADRDGIPDSDDQCPNEAEDFDGYEDTDGCPDYDNDGDGIADASDQCPNQAEDFDGYMDDDGCPDMDNDGDGIMDAQDNCPTEAETFNGFEDTDGCPDDAPIYFPIAHINFKFGTAEISGADPIPVLDEVKRIMNENPDIRVEIQGHTDNIGSDEANMQLSTRRAEAVKKYLVDNGIAADRIETRGFGEARPIDSNDTDLGRARNRRIEFVVIQ